MTTAKEKSRILVVEDEAIVAADVQDRLAALGYRVVGTTGDGGEAVNLAARLSPDLVLMDIMLDSAMDGVQAADLIRKDHDIPVIFLTAHTDEKTLHRAKISEPFGYIVKPFEEHSLHATIQMALYRHRSEQKVRRMERWLTAALSDANQQEKNSRQDMEFLAHAISHDLRSPLAALKIDTQMLGEGYTHALGKEGYEIVDGISQSIARMEAMISSYLQFTRKKNPVSLRREPVDMKILVNEVIRDLHQTAGARALNFVVRELPPAEGDPALLRQVWTNLLSNAVKYTRVREDAKITGTGRQEGGESIYEVEDNGIGFDPAQAGKLFTDYQRLHAASGIEGVGLGLSVVKQIIARHGGRVWATGQPDAGATFGFSLPSNLNPDSDPKPHP